MASLGAGDCKPGTCPVDEGFLSAPPSLAGTAVILAVFSALVPINLWVGARQKTTLYSLTLVTGLLMEVLGHVGSLLLRSDLASKTYFVLFLLGTTAGPTFITAAIYTILPHILAVYGDDVSIVPSPVWLNYFFLFLNIFTLFFQVLGSAFAAEGFNSIQIEQGVNVLVVGLALQISSILIFFGVYFWFLSKVVQNRDFLDPRFSDIYFSARFKASLLCIQFALTLILIRTVARLVQLCSGLDSALSQSPIYVPILDGVLVLLATIFITILPPGPSFGRAWGATSPSQKKSRRHLAALDLVRGVPGSPAYRLHEHESPFPSPRDHQADSGYGAAAAAAAASSRRYSPGWAAHKRQASAGSGPHSEPPAYERPLNNYARVPYVPPPAAAASLSQQYGQGRVVESQVTAPGSEGTRTGGSGSGGRTRTRSSPRVFEVDMVRHDAIW